MEFTYKGYAELLELLARKGYAFADYHNYMELERCVILRHDIDRSPRFALPLAETEAEHQAASTWFVRLSSSMYNALSQTSRNDLRSLQAMGHEIGLHFDEAAYTAEDGTMEELIRREADILANVLGSPVSTVSMHRPAQHILNGDMDIPGMVNAYSKVFFQDFKYLSDSRRRWREPVEEVIASGMYPRLNVLTHAFWYRDREETIEDTVRRFITSANQERYQSMAADWTDLGSVLQEGDV